jgi:hypothetical protein
MISGDEATDEETIPQPKYMQKIRQPRKSKEIDSFRDEVQKEDRHNSLKVIDL